MHSVRWIAGRAGAFTLALAIGACAGRGDPQVVPTPSVHELARLQQSGHLDPSRLECVIVAAGPLATEIRAASRDYRDLQQARSAAEGYDHARSVQQGMASSDQADVAARAALEARRMATQASLAGDHMRAAHFTVYAADALRPARDPAELRHHTVAVSQRGAGLSDREVDLFVEYAELRAMLIASGPSDERAARVREIEANAPAVMDLYAGLLLDLYEDPGVTCTGGDGNR